MLLRICCVLMGLMALSGQAQQLQFKKSQSPESTTLRYQWQDQFEQVQTLAFSFSQQTLNQQYQSQTEYKPKMAQRYVYVSMMKYAQSIDPRQARIDLRQMGDKIQVKVRSRKAENIEKFQGEMADQQDQAFAQYLLDNHYTIHTDYMGKDGVIPDHIRYIKESHETLLPVAQAIYDRLEPGSDTRDYINLLLSWIQTIPYDTLENRLSSNGAGFVSPVELLINNQGDCDSKVTLMATLMRALLPNMSIAIVYLPNHALLAVNLGHKTDDETLEVRGTPHIMLEPTGPALLTMGNISPQSKKHIASGRYTTLIVP